MTIVQELLEFSASRPAWQQDLMRRICTQQSLQSSDIQQVLDNLKASHGLKETQEVEPLREEHLSRRATAPHTPVALAAISNVRNANQLAPDQRLPFALEGITLIYGHNGSGKTGYARIVKQLCRVRRDKAEPLLGNVYKGSSYPAEAEIAFLAAGKPTTFHWKDGDSPPATLSQISVFDASCAPLYADHQNEIQFLPWGLDVLPNLGRACQLLAERVQAEIDRSAGALSVPLPQQFPGSTADALVRRLIPETPRVNLPGSEEIRQAAAWSAEGETELKSLEGELQKLSEPAKAAAQCRRFKTTVDAFNNRLDAIIGLLNTAAIMAYRDQFLRTQAAQEAASVAGKARFEKDPLGAVVGTPAWRGLYEMAEEFNSIAYPDEPFPAIGADKVCVLCQQSLGENAADRLTRFKEFMQDTSQQEARAQNSRLSGFISGLESAQPPTIAEMDLLFAELSAAEPLFAPVTARLAQFVSEASALRINCIAAMKGQLSFEDLAGLDATAIIASQGYAVSLDHKAKSFDEITQGTAVTTDLRKRHTALLARQQLNTSVATVLSRRAELEKYHALQDCKGQCDTYQISRKNTDFREKYLTVDFESEVRKQVKLFGLGYLPIKIDSKTEKGTSYVGVGLSKIVNTRNANILSEGEFRALALACFFAEIATIPNHNGIVVDDPVSSLDHRHMKQVAHRLVAEAKTRSQVIVFTHDLSFYYELWSVAAEAGVPVSRNWVQHRPPGRFGVVDVDEGPWQVKTTKERIGVLNNLLMRIPEEGQSIEGYAQDVQTFYTRLRETWERLVEECLLNNVVARFQPGVQTQSLKGVSVTNEDYSMVFFNMKKASEFSGHDWATSREGTPPSKEDMTRDLKILQGYAAALVKRSQELGSTRRSLEQPPKAQMLPPTPPMK
jgi:energy-coupling factor transporter ATP-binding protein EcfA2